MAIDDQLRRHPRQLQVSRWRGDARSAVVNPTPNHSVPSAAAVAREVERLAGTGVQRILTGALHHDEVAPFVANGFVEHDRLHLLRHDLIELPGMPRRVIIRRGSRRHLGQVLRIDHDAFDDFWTLDRLGIRDAMRATPTSRFRTSRDGRGNITGYSITGRAANRSYLQRLAVDPSRHGEGIGRALVSDALAWARRVGAAEAIVNTQFGNDPAFGLYRRCGFEPQPFGLTVLVLELARHRPHNGPGSVHRTPGT